jgi:hypothetical protein
LNIGVNLYDFGVVVGGDVRRGGVRACTNVTAGVEIFGIGHRFLPDVLQFDRLALLYQKTWSEEHKATR